MDFLLNTQPEKIPVFPGCVFMGIFMQNFLIFGKSYGTLYLALPGTVSGWPLFTGAASLSPDSFERGGCPMVTYSDLIQIGILVVGIIGLFLMVQNKK